MDSLTRRDFIKGLSVGTVAGCLATMGVTSVLFRDQLVSPKVYNPVDIGQVKGVTVKCISETSWFNNTIQMGDFKKAGGALVSQYDVKFTSTGVADGYKGNNAGGASHLVEVEFMDGTKKKILLDPGWNTEWMGKRFHDEGIDRMLKNREIDLLFVSHDHYDHFWAIETVLREQPDITIMIPNTFMNQSYQLLAGGQFAKPPISNSIPHKGKLIKHDVGKIYKLYPGVASSAFGCPCGRGVYGEQVLIFNVADKGIVTVTGCCHMGIISLLEFCRNRVAGGEKIYGVYGGLHISPYEDWDPFNDDLVLSIPRYNIQRIGCNHCTGYITVEKMLAAKIPVIKGSAKHLTKRDIYLGNGDTLAF